MADLDEFLKKQQEILSYLKENNVGSPLEISEYAGLIDDYERQLSTAESSAISVMEDKADIKKILDNEFNRLQQKKTNIDQAIEGRYRGTLLNENYRLRYMEYTKILIIFVISFITIIMVINFRSLLVFIPDFIIDFIIIVIASVSIISCFYIYMGILSRDKIYFNELALSPPTKTTPSNVIGSGKNKNQTLYQYLSDVNLNTCISSDCCAEGTFYNSDIGKCTIMPSNTSGPTTRPTISGFTTLDLAYKNNELNKIVNQSGIITANTPNEFNNYAVYN